MNLKKQVNVTFGKNPVVDGEAFLFEVAPSDVPYGIYGRDCVQIAQLVGQGAIPFCRKNDGKLISAEQRNRNLYTLLTTAIPSVRGGKVFMGDQEVSGDTSEHFSNIRGVAVKDLDLASKVDQLFKQRGYEIKKDYK